MKTDETNIQICVVFSSSKEVKFKVPAHLELIKKVAAGVEDGGH